MVIAADSKVIRIECFGAHRSIRPAWQIGGPGFVALPKRLATLLLGVCAGAWIGAGWLAGPGASLATLGLGAPLIAYAALGLLKWLRRTKDSRALQPTPPGATAPSRWLKT